MSTLDSVALTNWCGTHELTSGGRIVRPRDETEVRELLAGWNAPRRVQLLGGRHSWHGLIDAHDAVALDMTALRGIGPMRDDLVEVGAGTTLVEVHDALRAMGRRLAYSPPVIATQTVGGAIATGTHGQGLGQSTLGDIVRSLRFVDGRGRVHEIDDGDPDFGAFRLHLGCLGAVTSVWLRTVPNTVFTCEKRAVRYSEFLRHFVSWNQEYAFCKAWWFPGYDRVHLWLVRPATAKEERAWHANNGRLLTWRGQNAAMNPAVRAAISRMRIDTKTADLQRSQFQTVRRFQDFSDLTGDVADILCKGIPVPQINCEIGVSLDSFSEVQRRLLEWYEHRNPQLHYPLILRATGPSDAWLSAAHERDTCHYGLVVYQAEDGSFADSAFAHLREAQDILASAGGVPHWGKYFSPEGFDLAGIARWQQFQRVRATHDPDDRFAGRLLSSLFQRPGGTKMSADIVTGLGTQ